MFLGKKRDLTRVSTAVVEESLHLCPVHDVSAKTFTDKWGFVDINRQARMIAHTSCILMSKATNAKFKKTETKQSMHSPQNSPSIVEKHKSEQINHTNAFLEMPNEPPSFMLKSFMTKMSEMLTRDPSNISGIFAEIQESLHELMRESRENFDFLTSYSIRVIDSGGQPQFHEVVSIILPAITSIVSVFKLSEPLNAHGEVVFYSRGGAQANEPYKSYLTNEQIIRHNLLAIQSQSGHKDVDDTPNLAFVGTFLDEQHKCCDKTPDQKDERLHSMITEILPAEMQECVISNNASLKQVTFRVNTRETSEEDFQTVGRLKEALMRQSKVKHRKLPLKWCGYEIALRKVMEKLGRQTLSLKECEVLGRQLGFDTPSLNACLRYFRQLHIITFYDVLPHVIFASAQVILDKITELVTYSLKLKEGFHALCGSDRKFHQQGILSLEV